ncbi:MAG: biotin--[acetyl-CoA-carboxylase] ligase [Verrucomicrobia bacterium]|nr:biotin--[acetyl-CoA-carboxylase] ligase [Verrucomicrobiota bacterium]
MNRTAATSARTQRLAAKLLRVLRQGDATASELAAALRVSISETPALADHLASLGFDISRNPLLGYHLVSEPSQLCTEAILSYVEGEWLPNIVTVQSTGSTNTDAIRRGLYEDPGPFILFAEHQTDGRGRLGRSWESPPGEGLWMSFLLRLRCSPSIFHRITSLAALALSESVDSLTGVCSQIKWPNDVVVNGRKIAGILAETGNSPQKGPFVVVGVGINVNQTTFPDSIARSAASLRQVSGSPVNRARLAGCFIASLGRWLDKIADDFAAALDGIRARSSVLGNELTLYTGVTSICGRAEGLSENGELLLRLADGSLRTFNAGEVSLKAL